MEIDPIINKSTDELEEMCKGLSLDDLKTNQEKAAALIAYILRQPGGADIYYKMMISVSPYVDYLVKAGAFDGNLTEADVDKIRNEIPPNKVEEILKSYLLSLQHPFLPMANAPAVNTFMALRNVEPSFIDPIAQTATYQYEKLSVIINGEDKQSLIIKPSTRKLLDACTIKLTEINHYKGANFNPAVEFPMEEYMKLCGVPLTKASKDKMRQKIKEDLDTLYGISIEPEGIGKIRICQFVGDIKNGIIRFTFSNEMARYLLTAFITQFPLELFKLDERNESAYNLGRKLALHNSMDNNIRQGTANIISVLALLKVCTSIPEYEKVLNEGRQIEQRIIQPFEKALDNLNNVKWEYCNSKYETLTDEQAENMDYSIFKTLYIKFEIKGAPDQKQRLEEKTAREKVNKAKRKSPKKHTV